MWVFVSPVSRCLLAVAMAVPASAQQAYLSIERVRAALLKPAPRLVVENRQPDFRIHVEERRPFDDLFEIPLWETPVVVSQPPSLLAPIEGVPHATPALIQTTMDPTRFARSAAKSAREKSTRTPGRARHRAVLRGAARRGVVDFPLLVVDGHAVIPQASTSYAAPSSSSVAPNRCAWRSNIVL